MPALLDPEWDDFEFGEFPEYYRTQPDGTLVPMEREDEWLLDAWWSDLNDQGDE